VSQTTSEVIALEALQLKLSDGITIAVPASLASITTNVLLELETWFEKEIDFVRRYLRPGMTVIDIGANLGVYSLSMARTVGPVGQVFAYEPGSEARELLGRSRDLNGLRNLHIAALALSDTDRDGYLTFGESSEANALGDPASGTRGETVSITTLDAEDRTRGWAAPDFVKLDAEGGEEQIIVGAHDFFSRYSPLVMFEIVAGQPNTRLRSLFRSMGYRLFRSLADISILVPVDHEELDSYELNLFAAKSDRAAAMSRDGLLVDGVESWSADESQLRDGIGRLRQAVFAPAFPIILSDLVSVDVDYRKSLAAFAICNSDASAQTRCSALAYAFHSITELCERAPSAARLSTLARVAWHWGRRSHCVKATSTLFHKIEQAPPQLTEPFWPACPRFDKIAPAEHGKMWFMVSAAEQWERAAKRAGCFDTTATVLKWLWGRPFVSADIDRRIVLMVLRAGGTPMIPRRLMIESPDNLNADIWRSGLLSRLTKPGAIADR
jgi:FkbM family methyltransferase